MAIAVAGCVAQAEGEEILRRAPAVDLVFGPQTYHRLPDLLARLMRGEAGRRRNRISGRGQVRPRWPKTLTRKRGVTAFLTVQEGCDKFCTFCVVPYTRGAEFSRPVAPDRSRSAERLPQPACARSRCSARMSMPIAAQDRDGDDLARWRDSSHACHESMASNGLRYMTSHPRDMDDDLIAAHGENPKADALSASAGPGRQRPHAQGDEPRPSRARTISRLIMRMCARRGPISRFPAISSSAFPGETEADFEDTLALVREVGYASAFSFKYSPRPGTPGGGSCRIRFPMTSKPSAWPGSRRSSNPAAGISTAPASAGA